MGTNSYSQALPLPREDQAFVNVSALEAGHVSVRSRLVVKGSPADEWLRCPSLSFLLEHSNTQQRLLFDLGIRKNIKTLPPSIQDEIAKNFPVRVHQSAEESLKLGGMDPADIELIFLSHLHFDHVGQSAAFPKAVFSIHEACKKPLEDKGPFGMGWSLPSERIELIPDSDFTQSIGPFSGALDYFGDGSLYILQAPGHALGHINILARNSADGAWICLAGDSCHDPRVLTGEKDIPWIKDGMYSDLERTEKHLEKLRALRDMPRVQVLIAHDYEWYDENRESGAFFPGMIPPST